VLKTLYWPNIKKRIPTPMRSRASAYPLRTLESEVSFIVTTFYGEGPISTDFAQESEAVPFSPQKA
jgi:hypothetical protein